MKTQEQKTEQQYQDKAKEMVEKFLEASIEDCSTYIRESKYVHFWKNELDAAKENAIKACDLIIDQLDDVLLNFCNMPNVSEYMTHEIEKHKALKERIKNYSV